MPLRRTHELTISISADDFEGAIDRLNEVREMINVGVSQAISGGASGNFNFNMDTDPTWTHERYMQELANQMNKMEGDNQS